MCYNIMITRRPAAVRTTPTAVVLPQLPLCTARDAASGEQAEQRVVRWLRSCGSERGRGNRVGND
ncbi:MAG TPA: hypothetical protein VG253_15660, partial [Streptosporangiaceae bacterium]|nr:hypothetical protein [Streptosporangiaceae bacterium]